ncbi:MAG: hypothetical protein V4623_10685 [Pseudomonadota bacterium]
MVLIGTHVETTIQSALALGLSFPEIPTVDKLIERERASDSLIQGIDIFDNEGRVLYSTQKGYVGRVIDSASLQAAKEGADKPFWRIEAREYLSVGIGLQNNFGVTLGQLVIRYSRADLDLRTGNMGRSLLFFSLFGLAAAFLVLLIVLGALYRGFLRDLRSFEVGLSRALDSDGKARLLARRSMNRAVDEIADVLVSAHGALDAVEEKLKVLR